MVRLGLFFPFLTDCWYPSRKSKCKNHSWLHHCPPPLSPRVQTCSVWQQPRVGCRQGSVGAGFLSRRGAARRSWSQPCFLLVGIDLCQQIPVIDAGTWVSEEQAPTNPPHEPSVFNDLASGVGFFSPQQTGRFSVLCLVVSRYKSFQLASHFIGHFADHLLPAVGKGRKPLLGAEARLLPLGS